MTSTGQLLVKDASGGQNDVIGVLLKHQLDWTVSRVRFEMQSEGVCTSGAFEFVFRLTGAGEARFVPITSRQESDVLLSSLVSSGTDGTTCIYVRPKAATAATVPSAPPPPSYSAAAHAHGPLALRLGAPSDSAMAVPTAAGGGGGDEEWGPPQRGKPSLGLQPPPRVVPLYILVRVLFNWFAMFGIGMCLIAASIAGGVVRSDVANSKTEEELDEDRRLADVLQWMIPFAGGLVVVLVFGGKYAYLLVFGVPAYPRVVSTSDGCSCMCLHCPCSGYLKANGIPIPQGGWDVAMDSWHGSTVLTTLELEGYDGKKAEAVYGDWPYRGSVVFFDPKHPSIWASIESFGPYVKPDPESGRLTVPDRSCGWATSLFISSAFALFWLASFFLSIVALNRL